MGWVGCLCRTGGLDESRKLDVHRDYPGPAVPQGTQDFHHGDRHHDRAAVVLVLHLVEGDRRLARLLSATPAVSRLAAQYESGNCPVLVEEYSSRCSHAAGFK